MPEITISMAAGRTEEQKIGMMRHHASAGEKPSGPILTFAPRLGRHVCKCQNRRTTSKIKLLVELLDLTFAWRLAAIG